MNAAMMRRDDAQTGKAGRPRAGAQNRPCRGDNSTKPSPPQTVRTRGDAPPLQYQRVWSPESDFERYALLCDICRKSVCLGLGISLRELKSRNRKCADVVLARQIAMYLAHTSFGICYLDVGQQFGRDRTTVAYACRKVEDRRDRPSFEALLCEIEAMLCDMVDVLQMRLDNGEVMA